MLKAIISACLLGECCRYDGKTKAVDAVVEKYKDFKIIPFCPEAPLFGTPRERINVVEIDGENRIITDKSNIDVTKLLRDEINSFIKENPQADAIVLKSKSPSCGLGTTPILNEKKEVLKFGNGIAAEIFLREYKGINIADELLI
ncbi:DUF523 domain-containing protein [Sulfurimonas sp. CVO]|jgi:uncharacterized protein YbbK (DUF523 family)|uniref:DUF523 domain-containing protein n=1 Tax=Sulfurimonas xiamenensis TaxID=2590021 RepID=A0AAJ4A4Z8_9BACT|nr:MULTISPECIES: DUF523 domain-containing protein [Sulfurimonas]PLY12142.1 MAG: hypothetical protein C0628_08710 [Sulfurimonas sp.]QFR43996.1 DUF523 domain-containing protein [Sulfurimonas xiamenensis]QHG90461.1 DUF523 domain-containing protein [Sulfurimonas sp. CVO]